MHRRMFLRSTVPLPWLSTAGAISLSAPLPPDPMPAPLIPGTTRLGSTDTEFLDDMQRRCFAFFDETIHPTTGLIPDRGRADGSAPGDVASIAGCGFALASYCVAAERGWIARGEAAARCHRMLHFLAHSSEHQRGFLYHFIGTADGRRCWRCEASSVDTALLIAGALSAASYFEDDARIGAVADYLYRRVDWQWMLNGNLLLNMGWNPESGFLPYQWDHFSELVVLVLLAIGAPERAIPPECWRAWRREPILHHHGTPFVGYPPLFVYQYPLAFFDLRNWTNGDLDYWENARRATLAQVDFLKALGHKYPDRFGHYDDHLWGLTSSDSDSGYRDWGGPYEDGRIEPDRGIDGTVVPSAAAGALPMTPAESLRTLRHQHHSFGHRVYRRYGFVNAFNPASGWIGEDVIAIDTGITLLMAENLRSGFVWNTFMRHGAAERALSKAGFQRRAPAR